MIDAPQGSEEWHQERLGKLTASRIAEAFARTRGGGGWGASRDNYMAELILERITGVEAEHFVTDAMRRGTELEPKAREEYAWRTGAKLEEVGFVDHPRIAMSGASPDRLVGKHGLLEIKCPNTATHFRTLLGASIDRAYVLQMQWQMACTGRRWCDWVSYDDRVPERLQMHIKRTMRDDELIKELERDGVEFLAELADREGALRKLMEDKAA